MKGAIRKIGSLINGWTKEVILAALLTIAVGVFGFVVRAQVIIQERVTVNAVTIAKNGERIEAACTASDLQDAALVEQILNLRKTSDNSDQILIEKMSDLKERLDQRCDMLEGLIRLVLAKGEGKDTGG